MSEGKETVREQIEKLYDRDCYGYMRVVRPEKIFKVIDGLVLELQEIMERAHLDSLKECAKNKSQDANYYDGIRDGAYDILSKLGGKE